MDRQGRTVRPRLPSGPCYLRAKVVQAIGELTFSNGSQHHFDADNR